jgi:hypothetical protein
VSQDPHLVVIEPAVINEQETVPFPANAGGVAPDRARADDDGVLGPTSRIRACTVEAAAKASTAIRAARKDI